MLPTLNGCIRQYLTPTEMLDISVVHSSFLIEENSDNTVLWVNMKMEPVMGPEPMLDRFL